MARRILLALPAALPVAFATALAQVASPSAARPPVRADYALINVRIVTAPGRVGAALTGSPEVSRLSLRAGVGQEVAFGTRRGGYPGTGIGAVAFIRQSFLDAQYEARGEKAGKAGIPGARPSNDPFRRA